MFGNSLIDGYRLTHLPLSVHQPMAPTAKANQIILIIGPTLGLLQLRGAKFNLPLAGLHRHPFAIRTLVHMDLHRR